MAGPDQRPDQRPGNARPGKAGPDQRPARPGQARLVFFSYDPGLLDSLLTQSISNMPFMPFSA